jgi:hypothetical protein
MAEWLRPGKVLELYGFDKAQLIHSAVIDGRIGIRHRGKQWLQQEWAKLIAKRKWDPNSDFGLPPDIELSLEDVERVVSRGK